MTRDIFSPGGQAGSHTAAAPAGAPPNAEADPPTSVLKGIGVSLFATFIAALIYAGVATAMKVEFSLLAIAIGGAAACICWHTKKHPIYGIIAMIIALAGFNLAIVMSYAGISSRSNDVGFIPEFLELMERPLWVLKVYLLEGDIWGIIFLILALFAAYIGGAQGNGPTDKQIAAKLKAEQEKAALESSAHFSQANWAAAAPPPAGPPTAGPPPGYFPGSTPN